MSAAASAWALELETGSPTNKLVLLVLADRHNKDTGKCCPSITLLAHDTELSESSVKRALRDLAKRKILTRDRQTRSNGSDSASSFTLHMVGGQCDPPATVDPLEPKEPDLEQDQDPLRDKRARERNLVWDALVAVTGFDPTTTSEKSDFGKTVRELRAVIPADATGEQIERAMAARKRAWVREYPDAKFTHRVLRGKWAELGALAVGIGAASGEAFPAGGVQLPEEMLSPENYRAWARNATPMQRAHYQDRFNVDDHGKALED